MPPRDDQEYESRRQQIIDGALEVFATKGFEKATNKDIAGAAGIGSPGLIYHYFKDKADLFRQMMEQRAPSLELLLHADEMMELPPREVLTRIGQAFIQTVDDRRTMAILRVVFGEVTRRPAVAQMVNTIGPGRGLAFLRRYLEHQMDLGTLRRVDPGAATRCFIGPIVAFMVTREIFPQPDSRTLSAEQMVTTAIDVFLRGMSPDAETPAEL
jgi:AcrR family transcriptional regulator